MRLCEQPPGWPNDLQVLIQLSFLSAWGQHVAKSVSNCPNLFAAEDLLTVNSLSQKRMYSRKVTPNWRVQHKTLCGLSILDTFVEFVRLIDIPVYKAWQNEDYGLLRRKPWPSSSCLKLILVLAMSRCGGSQPSITALRQQQTKLTNNSCSTYGTLW